jgi:MinD superfamily P-loop ATPase
MVFPNLCHACYACSELCPVGALPMQQEPMGELRHTVDGDLVCIESRLLVGQEQAVPLIRHTLGYIERTLPDAPVVLLDAPPGTSCPVIEATRHADLVLLVTEPTPFGLHDLSLAVETMRQLGRPLLVVINRHGIGDAGVEDYCAREGLEIAARIPHDRRVAELYAEGRLPAAEVPAMREALEALIARLRAQPVGGGA